ncbi:MAG: Fic family protein [Haliea sp.]
MSTTPPFTLTPVTLTLCTQIAERVGRIAVLEEQSRTLHLRRLSRIRTVQGSLAIEGNTLSESQITAILDGKRVLAPPKEIQEAHNALSAYDHLDKWYPHSEADLLAAHSCLMAGLLPDAGRYRQRGVGVMSGEQVVHMAPPASRVPLLMHNLLVWLQGTDVHPLIASSVFHYEFEFIHPFSDGNGRVGRLWQTLILSRWQPLFAYIPVESLVHQHQQDYYAAIRQSTAASDSSSFVLFRLERILEAIDSVATERSSPHDAPQVTPQVAALLRTMRGEMSRDQIMTHLNLSDRKSFVHRYLQPALKQGLIEMTLPDKPRSRLQRYRLTAAGRALAAEKSQGV